MRYFMILISFISFCLILPAGAAPLLLVPERVFDGFEMHEGWAVLVDEGRIHAAGPEARMDVTGDVVRRELSGATLLPGLIDAHSHVLLHPYSETSWTDQVLKESIAERSLRAGNHLKASLNAGFTTLRDLGSEGAGYADVGLRQALEKGVINGPRLIVAGPAIVATGSYAPRGFAEQVHVPKGAEEADGDQLIETVRRQIGGGADFIKIYADYRWGPNGETRPTFSVEELKLVVETAASSGRDVVAHAGSDEGMRRAALAGVVSIEHGDGGSLETFQLMADRGIVWCPTLAAGEAVASYAGWDKAAGAPPPERVLNQRQAFKHALKAGVDICMGSDVGVFAHGKSAREMALMVEYGMEPLAVLRAATSLNARLLRLDHKIGRIRENYLADLIAVEGNPIKDIKAIEDVIFVMQGQ